MKKIMIFIIMTLLLQGCGGMTQEEKNEVVQKSTESAIEYFKEQKGWDVVIDSHEFTSRTNGTEIFLYGYQKGNEDNKIHAMVNFAEEKYEVSLIGYDEK